MELTQNTELRTIEDEDEISLLDIIQFFRRNWTFMAWGTLGLSAVAIALSLLMPKQYQKQLTLSVTPVPISVAGIPGVDIQQASNKTVKLLENYYDKIDETDVKPTYNTETQQIDITMRSPDTGFLAEAGSQVSTLLQQEFQDTLGKAIANSLFSTELEITKQQQVLEQLEQQIAQVRDSNGIDPERIRTTLRLEALETQRAEVVARIASLEFDKQYLEPAQENLAEFTAQVISIQLLSESKVEPTRSLVQIAVLAAIASFMVAILAAIIRDQARRLKDELSQKK
ncbi:MAG: hypothetical protein RH949_19345 [Coleofasciculus sp. A1-SPW-01]|uniref:hypothetical protein n=1 Tax=Coleofasciculus sp. A1-SPW-01 TaxID=3070819 RepID=UPI0032F28234